MIKIINTSREFDSVEKYLMTVSPAIVSIKDVEDGTKIKVSGVMVFLDEKENGDAIEIMSIITPDKKVYACQSKTFKGSMIDILDLLEDRSFSIVKISGKTKAGRDFINCILDVETVG